MLNCAIISIGSELLSGQIINRNAPWLSSQLFELGVDTAFQITVDDKIEDIVEALDLAAKKASLIFCTGGLGPTSDDLTRLAVSMWLKDSLVFQPESWDHITEIFGRFQLVPPDTNKQQCYFPSQAKVLFNRAGTANGFIVISGKQTLVVLPGPPKEIEAIWQDHLKKLLLNTINSDQKKAFFSWRTIGRGESHIAEIVESICTDLKSSNSIDLAYRAHAPFIETKIRFDKIHEEKVRPYLEQLSAALDPWLYESGEEHWSSNFSDFLLSKRQILFIDYCTSGQLQSLLVPWLGKASKDSFSKECKPEILFFNGFGLDHNFPTQNVIQEIKNKTPWYLVHSDNRPSGSTPPSKSIQFLVKITEDSESWDLLSWDEELRFERRFPVPYKSAQGTQGAPGSHASERNGLAIAALAIKSWCLDWNSRFTKSPDAGGL